MTPEQIALLLDMQTRQLLALERLADAVERLAPTAIAAPNYSRSLESFATFDWHSIKATVERSDQHGAAIVSWNGALFVRRSPANKFGEAIWFSRCTGKDENGENKYEKLITFKPTSKIAVEPLPEKVLQLTGSSIPV